MRQTLLALLFITILEAANAEPHAASLGCSDGAKTKGQKTCLAKDSSLLQTNRVVSQVAEDATCQSWCATNTQKWLVKCFWSSGKCKTCPQCDDPEAADAPRCQDWCESHSSLWTEKCFWSSGSCGGCPQCDDPEAADAQCQDWCESHSSLWSEKCFWSSGSCGGCPQCDDPEAADAPRCEDYCATNSGEWSEKCFWSSGKCATCPECDELKGECVAISENRSKDQVFSIVLMGAAFTNLSEWTGVAKEFSRRLTEFQPLDAHNIDALNLYYVRIPHPKDTPDDPLCKFPSNSRVLWCDSYAAERHVNNICGSGNRYSVLIVYNTERYGGVGGIIAATTRNWYGVPVGAHELGHSFFGLADEYIYTSEYPNCPTNCNRPTSANCDVDGCPKWKDLADAGFEGVSCTPDICGSTKGERLWNGPMPDSVMRTVASKTFGHVNQRIACCKYLAHDGSIPGFCQQYDDASKGLNLMQHCGESVFLRQVSRVRGQEVSRILQEKHVHVSHPVEWELRKHNDTWSCDATGEARSPGFYPLAEVEGDTAVVFTGARIKVNVSAGEEVHELYFNECEEVDVPRPVDGSDDFPLLAQECIDHHTVILNEGENCVVDSVTLH